MDSWMVWAMSWSTARQWTCESVTKRAKRTEEWSCVLLSFYLLFFLPRISLPPGRLLYYDCVRLWTLCSCAACFSLLSLLFSGVFIVTFLDLLPPFVWCWSFITVRHHPFIAVPAWFNSCHKSSNYQYILMNILYIILTII